MGHGWPIDEAASPSYLYVDRVRVYAPRPWRGAGGRRDRSSVVAGPAAAPGRKHRPEAVSEGSGSPDFRASPHTPRAEPVRARVERLKSSRDCWLTAARVAITIVDNENANGISYG